MVSGIGERVNKLFARGEWGKARELIIKALNKDLENHWLLTRLSTTYYEEKNYAKALELAQKANQLAPKCPLVLWDLAGAQQMTGDVRGALVTYINIIAEGPKALGEEECGEGLSWAHALMVDCIFRIGTCFRQAGVVSGADAFFNQFIDLRARGSESIYNIADALALLSEPSELPPLDSKKVLREAKRGLSELCPV